MSCCGRGNKVLAEELTVSRKLDKKFTVDVQADNAVLKILLLGAGESGKSTLFKQISNMHGVRYTDDDRRDYVFTIFQNCIVCIQTLITESDRIDESLNTRIRPELAATKAAIMELAPRTAAVKPDTAAMIKLLWKDPGIQETYQLRSRFQLPDCAQFFFERIDVIGDPDYLPSDQDIFRCRIPTTGVIESSFVYGGANFRLLDVGGQRNERKKWIHCFESVSSIIFVASLSEYDQGLFEDASFNRMTEALNLFDDMCNSKWFAETSIILFLNKSDLFAEKLKRVPLSNLFQDYTGGSNYDKAVKYIEAKFLHKLKDEKKEVFTFVTNATDTEVVKNVFQSASDIIISKNLKQNGLM